MPVSLPQRFNANDGLIVGLPRLMWLFVAYDLPVGSKAERRSATRFHRDLENLGFERFQFSIYRKFCGSHARLDSISRIVVSIVPSKGRVAIVPLTDKQVGRMVLYHNRGRKMAEPAPDQLCLL